MSRLTIFAVVLAIVCLTCVKAWSVRDLGFFLIRNPAFTAIERRPGGEPGYDLSISTFSAIPDTLDANYIVRDIANQLVDAASVIRLNPELLQGGVVWPNEVGLVPDDVFGVSGIRWSATGFLLPSKRRGNIILTDDRPNGGGKSYDITTSKCDVSVWFYHRLVWRDVNGDGRLDGLTARAIFDFTYGLQKAELVWLEHPEDPFSGEPWNIHYMFDGPDAFFTFVDLDTPDGVLEAIITPAYFSETIFIHWIEGPTTDWSDPALIHSRIIDTQPDEAYFDAVLTDVNRDNRSDILVTASSVTNGKLLAYEIPDDFRTDDWTRHLIADGFTPQVPQEGQGAPGIILPIHETTTDTNKKPLLLLTGDDDGNIYIFETDDYDDVNNWNYTGRSIIEFAGTVGAMSVADIDGDGYNEIFVPGYTANRFHIMTFAP